MADEKKTLLQMAEELNDMDRDMTSGEADFHDRVLKELRKRKKLKPQDEAKLELIHEKYLAKAEGEEESDEPEEETESEDNAEF